MNKVTRMQLLVEAKTDQEFFKKIHSIIVQLEKKIHENELPLPLTMFQGGAAEVIEATKLIRGLAACCAKSLEAHIDDLNQ